MASTSSSSLSGPGQTSTMMGTDPGQQMMVWPPQQQGGQPQVWTQPPPPWAHQFMSPPIPGPEGGPGKERSPPVLLSG